MGQFVRILISYLFVTAVVAFSYYGPTTPEHKKCLYGRQRKTGNDVTCYQFHGQKCAEGFYCKGGPYDSEGTCCLVNNPCYIGEPVSSEGNAMSCGWVGEKCPEGTYCQRDYHNNYGVCCPDMTQYFKCKYGRLMKNGIPMVCEHGNANMTCPPDSYCISLPGTYGVCCAASDPCSTGVPYKKDGNAVYCGHSEVGERCPDGYFCKIEIPGRHEICCPAEEPRKRKRVRCEIGQPLPYMTCSDEENKSCPNGYYCKTDPKDKSLSGCCQEPPPCPPMPGETTVTIFPPPITTQPTTGDTDTPSATTPTPTTITPTISVPTFVSSPATSPATRPPKSTKKPKKRPRKNKPKGRKKSKKGKPLKKSNKSGKNEPSGTTGLNWKQPWEKLLFIDWF